MSRFLNGINFNRILTFDLICTIVRRSSSLFGPIALDGPIEYKFVFKAASEEEFSEKLLKFFIIRGLFELILSTGCHVLSKLFGISMAKRLNGSVDLALFDLSILVVLISGAQALPREFALQQVQNYVSCTF